MRGMGNFGGSTKSLGDFGCEDEGVGSWFTEARDQLYSEVQTAAPGLFDQLIAQTQGQAAAPAAPVAASSSAPQVIVQASAFDQALSKLGITRKQLYLITGGAVALILLMAFLPKRRPPQPVIVVGGSPAPQASNPARQGRKKGKSGKKRK